MKRNVFLMLLGITALLAACSSNGEFDGTRTENQPPTVWLSAGPPEGSTGTYRVQMYWGGWDPDGEITGYEYLVTDNVGTFNPADTVGEPWSPVAGNDSVFTFSADQEVDTLNTTNLNAVFVRSHTFFIRAIDAEGVRSKSPAYRSFTSRTLAPSVVVDIPRRNFFNAAEVPPISTFKWRAFDYVDDLLLRQEPDSVQWALVNTDSPNVPGHGLNKFEAALEYLRSNSPTSQKEWYPWVWYRAPEDSGKSWTTPPIDLGTYIFAIRAKDEAGAITPVLDEISNVRRIKVAARNSGPGMSVTNEYLGAIRTTICTTPLTIFDSPAGVPLGFKINASADHYGGTVVGYRYGWDIADLNDPEQWEIDLTPFLPGTTNATVPPRTFYFGTHTITMEVVDNSGYCSRIQVKVNIVQFTLERSLLLVDDDQGDEASTGWDTSAYPLDAEHDTFWLDLVAGVSGFDPEIDFTDTKLGVIPLTTLAQYKSIIWYTYGDPATRGQSIQALLYKYIQHKPKDPETSQGQVGKVVPNVLALAMAAGSHIMISGKHPIQFVINRTYQGDRGLKYPVIWLYDLEGQASTLDANAPPKGDLSFAYRELCLETMDYAATSLQRWRPSSGSARLYCPSSLARAVGGLASVDTLDTMRDALPLDPNFPLLTLRPEVTGPGDLFEEDVRGLDVEVYNPRYFQRNSGVTGSCQYVAPPRSCFQPIYGLGSTDTLEPTYNQPIAFWTSAFADRVADVPGAVGARSIVFGFPPVLTIPSEFIPVMERVLFEEWQLPRGAGAAATSPGTAGSGASPR